MRTNSFEDRRADARSVDIETAADWLGLNLDDKQSELIGPCPVCHGDDRFSINKHKQVFNCRGCEKGGDVIALVMLAKDCDFKAALDFLLDDYRPPPPVRQYPTTSAGDEESKRALALELWEEAGPVRGTLAETYLRNRGIRELPPTGKDTLRFHGDCTFGVGVRHPCLISAFYGITDNKFKAIQRTALTLSGAKIDRRTLGSWTGGAVKLWCDSDVTTGLVIGEGLETTLSAALSIIHHGKRLQPAWCLGSAGNIKHFPILPSVESLIILVDNDVEGKRAAEHCAQRWSAAGKEVRRLIPRREGSDFNDIVQVGLAAERGVTKLKNGVGA